MDMDNVPQSKREKTDIFYTLPPLAQQLPVHYQFCQLYDKASSVTKIKLSQN